MKLTYKKLYIAYDTLHKMYFIHITTGKNHQQKSTKILTIETELRDSSKFFLLSYCLQIACYIAHIAFRIEINTMMYLISSLLLTMKSCLQQVKQKGKTNIPDVNFQRQTPITVFPKRIGIGKSSQ